MSMKDYLFKIIGLLIVWTGLTLPSLKANIFLITDAYDMTIAILVLATACLLTAIIWCLPKPTKTDG